MLSGTARPRCQIQWQKRRSSNLNGNGSAASMLAVVADMCSTATLEALPDAFLCTQPLASRQSLQLAWVTVQSRVVHAVLHNLRLGATLKACLPTWTRTNQGLPLASSGAVLVAPAARVLIICIAVLGACVTETVTTYIQCTDDVAGYHCCVSRHDCQPALPQPHVLMQIALDTMSQAVSGPCCFIGRMCLPHHTSTARLRQA